MSNARAKARPDLPAGLQVFGEYVIDQPIDEGPIWTVYRALHVTRQGERFHLWSMKATMSSDRNLVEGFARQARLLEKLSHKGITTVIATGVDQGVIFMVTPETKGQTLRGAMEEAGGRLPPAEVARVVREVAEVLDYLHNHRPQIVHRALEPNKIFLTEPDRQVKVLEVGYAHALLEAKVEPADALPRAPDGYRAPEDVAGQPVGAPVDQYSLACIAFEALTGKPISAAGTLPKDVIHPSVEAVLTRARSATVLGRYASAGAFADALARAISVTSKAPVPAPKLPGAAAAASSGPATGSNPAAPKPPSAASPAKAVPSAPKPPAATAAPAPKPPTATAPPGPGLTRSSTLGGPGSVGANSSATSPAESASINAPRASEPVTRPVPMASPGTGKVGFHQRRGTMVGLGGPPPGPSSPVANGALDGAIEIFGEEPASAAPPPASGNVTPQSGSTARFASLTEAGTVRNAAPEQPPAVAPAPGATDDLDADEVDLLVEDVNLADYGRTTDEDVAPVASEPGASDTDPNAPPPPLPYSVGTPPGVPAPITPSAPSIAPPAPDTDVEIMAPPPHASSAAVPMPEVEPPPAWPTARTTIPAPSATSVGATPERARKKPRSVVLPALGTLLVLGVLGAGGAYYGGLIKLPPALSSLLPPPPGQTARAPAEPPQTPAATTAHEEHRHHGGSGENNAAVASAPTHVHSDAATSTASTRTTPAVAARDASTLTASNAAANDRAGSAPAHDAGRVAVNEPAPPPAAPAPPPEEPAPVRPAHAGPLPHTPNAHDRAVVATEVQHRIDACNGHLGRHARMVVRYDSSGNVASINFAGGLFTGRPIGACIEAALRAVPVPPFSRPVWETDYSFFVR